MKRRCTPQNQAPHIFIYNYIICDIALSRANVASRQETSDTAYVIDRGYLSEGCDVWSCDRVMWSGGGKSAGGEGAASTRVLLPLSIPNLRELKSGGFFSKGGFFSFV